MKVKVEIVIKVDPNGDIWKDERERMILDFQKKIVSKEELCFGKCKYTLLEEFQYESMRDFIFDIEKDVENFEKDLYDAEIESFKIKEVECDWQARKYGWDY